MDTFAESIFFFFVTTRVFSSLVVKKFKDDLIKGMTRMQRLSLNLKHTALFRAGHRVSLPLLIFAGAYKGSIFITARDGPSSSANELPYCSGAARQARGRLSW